MACKLSDEVTEVVNKELDEWLNCNDDGNLVLLEVSSIIGLHKFDTTALKSHSSLLFVVKLM